MLKHCYDRWNDYEYGRSFESLIAALTEKQNSLVKNGAHCITWTLEGATEYGDSVAQFSIAYVREETDKERDERIAEENWRQERKRQEYERLKKEFG